MRFVALDVETANEDLGSICQIGLATFDDGVLTREWKTYVDPEDYFNPVNVSIHGINEQTVRGSPVFGSIADRLHRELDGVITAHHTFFDRAAILNAAGRYDVRSPGSKWLDTARVARRTWPEVRNRGYGLEALCQKIGYAYQAHDALEDAKAAGMVLLEAIRTSGTALDQWLVRAYAPIAGSANAPIARDGDPDGPLWGEVVVFTGALTLPRAEAAGLAAQLGCRVGQNITKETTILVVGDQDARKLNGHDKSSKQRKAEQLAAAGQPIRFLCETQFSALTRVLDDGVIDLDERREARNVVAAVAPREVPIDLGVVKSTSARGGPTPELLSVQFLRNASGSTREEAERSVTVLAELIGEDAKLAAERIGRLGSGSSTAEVLDELEDDVAKFKGLYGAVSVFLERSSLDAFQSQKLRSATDELLWKLLGAVRTYLGPLFLSASDDSRMRIAALIQSVDQVLAPIQAGAQEST